MQENNYVNYSIEEAVATITLNRPEAMNALDDTMVSQLEQAFQHANRDDSVKVIIFKSAGGKAFAAGADIKKLQSKTALEGLHYGMQEIYSAIEESPKVTIAIIDGYALGGGCELAMSCDIRIATERAKFGLPELNLGVVPGAGGTQRLPRLIGKGRALDMILTGRVVRGEEAYQIGLASYFAKSDEVDDVLQEIVANVLKKGPVAIKLAKLAILSGYDVDMKTAQWIEKLSISLLFGTEDKAEGTRAFVEKREANFTNR